MRRSLRASWLLLSTLVATPWAAAGVTVYIDAATLNEVLGRIAEQELRLQLTEGHAVTARLEGLRVTSLEPAATESEPGRLHTSVRLKLPELGLALTVQPRIVFRVAREAPEPLLELHFEEVLLDLPLAGRINIARMLPPLTFPAESLFQLDGAQGPVAIRSRLTRVRVETERVRLDFDVGVAETAPPGS